MAAAGAEGNSSMIKAADFRVGAPRSPQYGPRCQTVIVPILLFDVQSPKPNKPAPTTPITSPLPTNTYFVANPERAAHATRTAHGPRVHLLPASIGRLQGRSETRR